MLGDRASIEVHSCLFHAQKVMMVAQHTWKTMGTVPSALSTLRVLRKEYRLSVGLAKSTIVVDFT